jgi:hypothetical protein
VVEAGQARRVYDWVGSAQLPAGTYYVHAAVDDVVAVNATWAKLRPVLGTFPCPVWARYPRWSDAWGIMSCFTELADHRIRAVRAGGSLRHSEGGLAGRTLVTPPIWTVDAAGDDAGRAGAGARGW